MASQFLEPETDSDYNRCHPHGAGKETPFVYDVDKYGNMRKMPLNMSRTFRRGAGEFQGYSSGYVSDRRTRRYLQQHKSPYAAAGGKYPPKTELHDFAKSKSHEPEKAGARHHASDVSDMENNPLLPDDAFSMRQAGREYAPDVHDAHYGLQSQQTLQGWTPMKARGLCREVVMTWNGSCADFAERSSVNPHSQAKFDPTIFHLAPEISRGTFHAGDRYELEHLPPFERKLLSLNEKRGKIQPLAIVITEYNNPFPFPVGVVWEGYPLANRVQYGNNHEKVMMVLMPGRWSGQTRMVDFRESLRADQMQLAASIDPNDLTADILNRSGPGPMAMKKVSLLFDCACALAKKTDSYGNPLVEWDPKKLSEFTHEDEQGRQVTYVANVPRATVTFVLSEIEKQINRKSWTVDIKRMHWRLVPLNPGGSFKDYSGTMLQWHQENNPALFEETIRMKQTVTMSCSLVYV